MRHVINKHYKHRQSAAYFARAEFYLANRHSIQYTPFLCTSKYGFGFGSGPSSTMNPENYEMIPQLKIMI